MIKAYSYIRFSSVRQKRGDSVRRQMQMAEDYAREHNLELQRDSFKDLGVSAFRGGNYATGALASFLELVNQGVIEAGSYLLVENFDRLSREHVETALQNFLAIIQSGVVVVTLSDGNVFKAGEMDSMRLMMSIMFMARANDESQQKSRRTKAVWDKRKEEARETGKTISNSNYPRWLELDGDRFSVRKDAGDVLNWMFTLAKDGMGYEQIAKTLRENGHKSFQKQADWTAAMVGSVLKNKSVMGEYQPHVMVDGERVPDGEPIPHYYPQAIEPQLFLAVQNAIKSRNKRGAGYRKGSFSNLFMGVIECECGRAMTLGGQSKTNGASYLRCQTITCKGNLRYQYAEPQMLVALSSITKVIQGFRPIDHGNELAELELSLEANQKRLAEMAEMMAESPSATLANLIATQESEAAKIQAARNELVQQQAAEQERAVTLLTFEELDTPQQRATFNSKLRLYIDRIVANSVSNPDEPRVLEYWATVDGKSQVILTQEFESHWRKSTSTVYDHDMHVVSKAQSCEPHVLTDWIEELADQGVDIEGIYTDVAVE